MSITKTTVEQWSESNEGNSPGDGEFIAKELAAQYRNIKSAYRGLSFNKGFEIPDLELTGAPANYLDILIVYSFVGNKLDLLQVDRRFFARHSNGQIKSGQIITSVYTAGENPYTTIAVAFIGAWDPSYSEIFLGIDKAAPAIFPCTPMGGTLAFTGTETTKTVDFAAKVENTDPNFTPNNSGSIDRRYLLPVKNYHVNLHVCFATEGAEKQSAIVARVTKDFSGFLVQIFTAPGTDNTVIFDWIVTFPAEGM